jgi:hypothetical protein
VLANDVLHKRKGFCEAWPYLRDMHIQCAGMHRVNLEDRFIDISVVIQAEQASGIFTRFTCHVLSSLSGMFTKKPCPRMKSGCPNARGLQAKETVSAIHDRNCAARTLYQTPQFSAKRYAGLAAGLSRLGNGTRFLVSSSVFEEFSLRYKLRSPFPILDIE